MTTDELFAELDLDSDNGISRDDLHGAALRLGWQWPEASLNAVLDLLALHGPIERECFASIMEQIAQDPFGPYGAVLESASQLIKTISSGLSGAAAFKDSDCMPASQGTPGLLSDDNPSSAMVSLLENVAGAEAGDDYRSLIAGLGESRFMDSAAESALLLIDLQRSFTCGAWIQSSGSNADCEAAPVRLAFDNCARLLYGRSPGVDKMFTRCPFPPDSYDWDERVASIIGRHPYFVKPGNSVFWPPTNGCAEWVEELIDRGKKTLFLGGCTLNSCVRVSAIDTQMRFSDRGLQVVVVLSLSGARTSNYLRSTRFGGVSAVELAVREMLGAGVLVCPDITWK